MLSGFFFWENAMRRLTEKDAAQIKGMVRRGDKQMEVGTYFQVNQARVSELLKGRGWGKRFAHIRPAPAEDLPPPGPYVVVAKAYISDMEKKALVHSAVVDELKALLERYRTNI
jgi:hypothetical protein